MPSTRNPASLYYKKYDFPESLLHYWNDTRWKGQHLKFNIDEFSKEEALYLSQLINDLPPIAGRHFHMRYIEKLSFQEIANRNEESYDSARTREATAIRILFSKIEKQKERFSSLHWQHDYLYQINFSYGFPPTIENFRVSKCTMYNDNKEFTVISETSGLTKIVKSDDLGKCIDHIVWLSDNNPVHAARIFKEYLEQEISEMESKLPAYKTQLLHATEYLS